MRTVERSGNGCKSKYFNIKVLKKVDIKAELCKKALLSYWTVFMSWMAKKKKLYLRIV